MEWVDCDSLVSDADKALSGRITFRFALLLAAVIGECPFRQIKPPRSLMHHEEWYVDTKRASVVSTRPYSAQPSAALRHRSGSNLATIRQC